METSLITTLFVWVTIGLIFLMVTILTFADVARKDFGSNSKKIAWSLVALFPFVGWIIYLIFGFRKGKVPAAEE